MSDTPKSVRIEVVDCRPERGTPITDRAVFWVPWKQPRRGSSEEAEVVSATVARELELSRAAAEDENDVLHKEIERLERENANLGAALAERQTDVNALMSDIRKCDEMLMRWFKAASPYATPGSLEEGLKKLEQSLVEAHPECRCHECTAIWERRYPTENAAPIDSTVKPSAWD